MRGYKINRVEFLGKWAVYMTVIGDDNFMSIHNRTGLTDQQARGYFIKDHIKEVNVLIEQKRQRERVRN